LAQGFLRRAGFTVYLPRLRVPRIRGGRRVEHLQLLFPGYGFVSILNGWYSARYQPGVIDLIMDGERPAVVRDEIIAEIRQREVEGAVTLPTRKLRRGDRVRITAGPFRELVGLYQDMKPHERVEVLLHLLGGAHRVTLPKGDVEVAE
jgi:transcriptional antiterminator RfaH